MNATWSKNNIEWVQIIEGLEQQLRWAMGELNASPGPVDLTPLPPPYDSYDPLASPAARRNRSPLTPITPTAKGSELRISAPKYSSSVRSRLGI